MTATDVLVVFGVLVSVGLVSASAVLNFRMGYRSADTEFDGMVYGLAAAFGDGLKAIVPFVGFWGWRARDYLAVTAAAVLFAALTTYSFTSALGFSAEHRATKESLAARSMEHHGDLRSEFVRNQERLVALGPQRTPEEVEVAIANLLKKPVGKRTVEDVSAGCTLNRIATRGACAEIGQDRQELVRAQEAARLAGVNKNLRQLLDEGKGGNAASADPQIDALVYLATLVRLQRPPTSPAEGSEGRKRVGFLLSVVLAVFMELGSGLGLYIAMTPWRSLPSSAADTKDEMPETAPRALSLRSRVVDVDQLESFVLERLEPHPLGRVSVEALYADYIAWCAANKMTAYQKGVFERLFNAVAKAAGIGKRWQRGETLYLDVRLVGEGALLPRG